MRFRTKYDNDFAYKHAEISAESMCQSSGYMKVSDLVQQYQQAGLYLTAARQAQFDFAAGVEIPEDYQDITRYQDIDKFMLIDAYRERMRSLKAAAVAAAEKETRADVKDDERSEAKQEGRTPAEVSEPAVDRGLAFDPKGQGQ